MSATEGSGAAAAALAGVTSLLEAAPALAAAGYTMSEQSGTVVGRDETSVMAAAAGRLAPAVYVAVGACAPWAARWLAAGGGGQGQSQGFLTAVLRAVLAALRSGGDGGGGGGGGGGGSGGGGGGGRALAPAAGALAAVLGVARPSPADLLALPEMGEAGAHIRPLSGSPEALFVGYAACSQ
jgi:hypothetical protein